MCTVTFMPIGDQLIFTSNRDEILTRPLAFAPDFMERNEKILLLPKDPKAGGTWFAVANDGTVAVLLNGAFQPHAFGGVYRKSRGLVLLDIIAAPDPFAEIDVYDLAGIEPFTLLLFRSMQFAEFRWDGIGKYIKELSPDSPSIYSSAMLYEPPIIAQREIWFDQFLHDGHHKSAQSVRDFHSSAGRGDVKNGLVMSRGELLKTQCITQAVLDIQDIRLYHHDLIRNLEFNDVLPMSS